MEKDRSSYLIDIKGSAHGNQRFEFPLDMTFFDSMGNNRIVDVEYLSAVVEIERSKERVEMILSIDGEIVVECDRCLEDLGIPIEIEKKMTIKFFEGECEEDIDSEEILMVDRNSGELDVSQLIYDTVMLSIPIANYHDDGECNEDIVRLLNNNSSEQEEKITPFSNLKDLMNNKNS